MAYVMYLWFEFMEDGVWLLSPHLDGRRLAGDFPCLLDLPCVSSLLLQMGWG